MSDHERFMARALELAEQAAAQAEVPIGAVLVKEGKIIAEGFNLREKDQNVLRHAELIAIEEACNKLKSWRLLDTTLYVTLEPCLMCAGAIYQARIPRVVFGTLDPKAGACGSLYEIQKDARLNHQFEVVSGVLGERCSELLKEFFRAKR